MKTLVRFTLLANLPNHSNHTTANAVARLDNLEFLSDVVPRKTTVGRSIERRKKEADAQARAAAEPPREHPSPIQQFAGSSGPHAPTSGGHSRGPSGSGQIYTNGVHHSPTHSFQGPPGGGRANPVNLLDDGDAMEVDRPPTSSGMGRPPHAHVPSTVELLERARAAQARAELGLSHSPSLPPGGP